MLARVASRTKRRLVLGGLLLAALLCGAAIARHFWPARPGANAANDREIVLVAPRAEAEEPLGGPPHRDEPEMRGTLRGHTDRVFSIAFSPDGKTLASASGDRTVRLWDLTTDKSTTILRGHTDLVLCVAFSPDGKTLASAGVDGTVRLWDIRSGKNNATLQDRGGIVHSVAFSPDGKALAWASEDYTVKVWDLARGKERFTLRGHAGFVESVAFSPDGKALASGSLDRTVRLWDVARGKCTAILRGHADWVFCVAFSPDGQVVASGAADGALKLWDVGTGQNTATSGGRARAEPVACSADRVESLAFSPDGKVLASASFWGVVRLWDLSTGKGLASAEGPALVSSSAVFTPDHPAHNVGRQSMFRPLSSVAFSPDGRTLAAGGLDKTVYLWNLRAPR